jgi:hypothetical protein
MANITIVKLKVRRGSDEQRKQITLDQGEVGYTLDTRRLFVGDGATLGGRVIGNTSVGPFSNITNLGPADSPGLQVGDIGYANSKLYRLTSFSYDDALSGYAYIGNLPDESTITFGTEVGVDENKLTVKSGPGGLNATHFDSDFFGDGLLSSYEVLQPSLNTDYLAISGTGSQTKVIAPVAGSITQREINQDAIGLGLSGGTEFDGAPGSILSVNINPTQFKFDADATPGLAITMHNVGYELLTIPVSAWAESINGSNMLNGGLTYNQVTGTLEADVKGVDGVTITQTPAGDVQLPTVGTNFPIEADSDGTGRELNYPIIENGLTTSFATSIYDVVTGLGLSGQNVGDNVPIGAIIPHAQSWPTAPAGYLLCNGAPYSRDGATKALFDVIGTDYGSGDGGSTFNVPALTGSALGMPGFLYGANDQAPQTTSVWVSGGSLETANSVVSGLGVNYIIKYQQDPLRGIFNGSPDQINNELIGAQDNQVYRCIDSAGDNVQLSSGGFIRFALSGATRDGTGTYNKFAIPVFNYE